MLKPLGTHVLVEPVMEKSAMVLPEASKGQAEKGIVRGVGSKVEEELFEGDEVLYRKYSPEEFDLDGKAVYLIEEQDLMAKEYGRTTE